MADLTKEEIEKIKAVVEAEEGVDPNWEEAPATEEDKVWAEQVQARAEEHDEFANRPLEAATTAAAGAATFGLSNKLIKALGIRSEEDLRKIRQYNRDSATAGTIGGIVLPALLPGGQAGVAASIAKGIATPARAAMKAGALTEKAVASALKSKATGSAVKEIVKKGVAKGAGSAVEGAAFGVGALLDEASIGEVDLNAENLMSYGGLGALYGGAIGTALPTVGGSIAAATGSGKRLFGSAAKKFINPADDAADLLGYTPSMKAKVLTNKNEAKILADLPRWLREDVTWKVGDNAQTRLNKLQSLGTASGKRIDEIIEEADTMAAQAATDEVTRATLTHQRRRLFEDLADRLEEKLKKELGSISSKNPARMRLERYINDLRTYARPKSKTISKRVEVPQPEKVTTAREVVKRDGSTIQNKYSTKTVRDNREVTETYIETIKKGKVVKTEKVGEKVKPITKKYKTVKEKVVLDPNLKPITASEIRQLRNSIWDEYKTLSFEERGSKSGLILSRAYGELAEGLENYVERIAPGLKQELKTANSNYSRFKKFEEPLAKRTSKEDNLVNFRDLLFGGVGYGIGGELGILAAGARKLYNSDIKKKVTVLANMEKANKQALVKMDESISNFFSGSAKPAKLAVLGGLLSSDIADDITGKEAKNKREAYANISRNIKELVTEPEMLETRMARATSVLSAAAPQTSVAITETISRAIFFINSKIPKPANPTLLGRKDFEPSSMELAKFERYFEVVNNPLSVLSELENGTLTREHVEALEAVYPRMYEELRFKVLKQVQVVEEEGTQLAYSKKLQLGLLLNIPTDSSLAASEISALQARYLPNPEEAQTSRKAPAAASGDTSKLNFSKRAQTTTERVSEGE